MTTPTRVSPKQLAWLGRELPRWQADGLVDDDRGAAILERYSSDGRRGLAGLMSYLGGAFVGVGLIWLVAANLNELPPLARLSVVVALWLVVTSAAELLARRPAHDGRGVPSPVVGALRGLSSLAFGAVIFQAAQSLQVPAYEPSLVGLWGLGALVYAYAVCGVAPLVVGLGAGLVWFSWHLAQSGGSAFGVVLSFLAAAALAAGVAVLHDRFGPAHFATPWREIGALLALVGLFAAAVPGLDADGFEPDPTGWVALVLALAVPLAGAALARGPARWEPLAALGVVVTGTLLLMWEPSTDLDNVGVAAWAHAGASISAYVAAATWIAVLGIRRGSDRLTYLALVALVGFTTFQSFAVFARIIEGAWLFLVLGAIFLGSGYLFDRARRGLTDVVEGASA